MLNGNLYLHGGGDPSFGSLQLSELADQLLLDQGLREITGRVIGDETAFDARRGPPSEGFRTTFEVGGPLSALTFNRGRTGKRRPYCQASPARFAARELDRAAAEPRRRRPAAPRGPGARRGALPLVEHRSPTLAELARVTNRPSDNFNAETLIKALGSEFGSRRHDARRRGRREAHDAELRAQPEDRRRLGPLALRPHHAAPGRDAARAHGRRRRRAPRSRPHWPSRAATARSSDRMRRTAARDRCHGKTGTLHDVSALAGYCQTTAGARVAFAILMNGVNPYGARRLQDRMVAALARYSP